MRLNDEANRSYSKAERTLFKLLPKSGRKIRITELTVKYYEERHEKKPRHGRVTVNSSVRALIDKIEENNEPFKIHHSGRHGPNSSEVWVESR